MEDAILVASIALRLAGVTYSGVLLYRVRDRRFAFLTLLLSLMALRQLWTLGTASGGPAELPGLAVSGLAILTVYYLSQYVDQEAARQRELAAANDRLRSFQKAIEHAGHAIFLTDPDGTITYANPATETVTGYPPETVVGRDPSIWNSDYHDDAFFRDMWNTILGGEVWEGEIVNERRDGEQVWVDMTIAPIENAAGAVEQFVAVDTDVTEQKRRKHRIEAQNDRLAALNHTNKVLRDVNQHLVQAASREEIEAGICHEFADAQPYEFAAIVTRNLVSDTLTARTVDGIDAATAETFLAAVDAAPRNPVRHAIESDEVAIVDDVADQPWGDLASVAGCETVVAVPLRYGTTTYGALVICERSDALRNLDTPVLGELGATVGYAINAVESKQALVAERVTEVELAVSDAACPTVCLADRLDCPVDLEWLTRDPDGDLVAYYGVDADCADVAALVADAPDLQLVTADSHGSIIRATLTGRTVAATLADHGALLTSETATAGGATCTAILPQETDVRRLLDALAAAHDDVQLLAQRDRERTPRTVRDVHSALVDALTDRQLQVLRTAYLAGFYEWPRQNTGAEIADILDINQSTFLQHLRTAERKLLDVLLADDTPSPRLVVSDTDHAVDLASD